jgi:RHS repeat-associated protein
MNFGYPGPGGSITTVPTAGSIVLDPIQPGGLATGNVVTFTATVKDTAGTVVPNLPVTFNIDGANAQVLTSTTTVSGTAIVTYTGNIPGTDIVQAFATFKGVPLSSGRPQVGWSGYPITAPPSGPPPVPDCTAPVQPVPGWITSPAVRSQVNGLIGIQSSHTLQSGTLVDFWPATDVAKRQVLITTTSQINAGNNLVTLDTSSLANGSYIVRVCGTDTNSVAASSMTLFDVVGENKPGRVAFSLTDLTVPVAGLPVVIGRTYDSLNRNNLGDFGYGWDLSISSPKLEVSQAGDVTLTTLDGKRTTFYFTPTSPGGFLGFMMLPTYTAEAGVYGTLSSNDCGLVTPAGSAGGYVCFPGGRYDPASYDYRDPYGRVYTIEKNSSGAFKLTRLADLNGNVLTFADNGISSSSAEGSLGQVVQFNRASSSDPNCPNCIQSISVINQPGQVFTYTNSTTGDLTRVTLPQNMPGTSTPISLTYSYYTAADGSEFAHLFKGAVDPRGNTAVTSNYYSDGKLKEVVQPVNSILTYTTTYTYDQANNITTVTNPDGGTTTSQTDAYGKVISETQEISAGVYRTTQYNYNAKHQMTSSQVGSAPAVTYTYDSNGNQSGVTDQLGHTSTTIYNPYGGPLSITDPVSHTWNVSYDDNFMPTVVTDSVGSAGGYTFDSRGSILSRSDGNGKTTTYSYDQYGNKVSETDPLGNTTRYAYDTLGHVTFLTDTTGVATKNNYDALGRLTSTIAAYNSSTPVTTSYTYDANGNTLSETDAYGRTTSYSYDNANRLTQTTYPAVNGVVYSTTNTYDWQGNKLTETDQAGHMTRYGYNLAGQVISTTTGLASNGTPTPDTVTASYEYDNLGRKVKDYNAYSGSGTLPGSQPYTGYQYDAAGRLITSTNQLGYNNVYTYDAAGHKLTQTDANSLTTSYHYDSRGRLDKTTYPTLSGGTVVSETQSYDGAGNLASKTDGNGKTTSYSYDAVSRLITVTNPLSQATSYTYDALGRLKTILDANQHSTGFEYDALGRQTRKVWPDNTYEQYGYDLLGNQTSVRLSDGTTNTFSYDEWNRLQQSNFADSRVVTFTYTATGQRLQVTDSSRGTTPVTYGYDNLGRPTSITQPGGNIVSYSYDARGNRTAITTTVGSVISATNYSYSAANQLSTVVAPTDPGSVHTTYTYDPAGRKTQQNLPNGVIVQYSYDQLNRLLSINQSKNGVTPLASYTYTLDKAGNRTGVTEGSGRTISWGYDNAYRLTSEVDSASPSITTTYSYDGVGNRQSMTVGGTITTTYQYNNLDQLTGVTGPSQSLSYSYVRGDLTQAKDTATNTVLQSYSWDSADRLVGATVSGGSATYAYDADGRRIKQVASGTTTNYLWDETSLYGDVLVEIDSNNAVKTSYTLGDDELIFQKKVSVASPDYYLKDGQSSVRNLTDNTGNLESGQSYTYDAFGNLTSGQTSPASNYLYTGQQFDALTGLYDLRARYYKPSEGRFSSQDKWPFDINNPIELDRYNYTSNNPVTFGDPTGYQALAETGLSSTIGKTLLFGVGVSAVGVGVYFGHQILEYIEIVTASVLIGFAQWLAEEAKQAATELFYKTLAETENQSQGNHFTVAVAEGLIHGTWQTFITLSDFYINGPIKVFEAFGAAAFNFLVGQTTPARFRGGNFSFWGNYAKHAEEYMVELLQDTPDLDENQLIIGAVSNPICQACQDLKSRVSRQDSGIKGPGVFYMINREKKIRLFLAARFLD